MNKPVSSPRPASISTPKSAGAPDAESSAGWFRETVESIVIALVLAFLFRTFEAEAFVIPTGSMAPTLQGRHRSVECPQCHLEYRVSASGEVNEAGQNRMAKPVMTVTCPQCRFPYDATTHARSETFNGDRILVGKFAYEWSDPQRWDVFVFHCPDDAKTNYIKRLVGLPNETLRIYQGDLYAAPLSAEASLEKSPRRGRGEGGEGFVINRKPPAKLRAMLQLVYDNDFQSDKLIEAGWPPRWQAVDDHAAPGSSGVWRSMDNGRAFEIDGKQNGNAWLRYRHLMPRAMDWTDDGSYATGESPRPMLITDHYAYNDFDRFDPHDQRKMASGRGRNRSHSIYNWFDGEDRGISAPNWVGDLAVEATINTRDDSGVLLLDLVKGGKHFRCSLDVATGKAEISIVSFGAHDDGGEDAVASKPMASADTAFKQRGAHDVMFANCDDRLYLWIDGKHVDFGDAASYDNTKVGTQRPQSSAEDPGDLAPVGIGSRAADLQVSHVRVFRDVYYIANSTGGLQNNEHSGDAARIPHVLDQPESWRKSGGGSIFDDRGSLEFVLKEDQFFAMGDNSPFSRDARMFDYPWVPRELIVGKAAFIYWPSTPHAIPLPVPGREIDLPYFPAFDRMKFVR